MCVCVCVFVCVVCVCGICFCEDIKLKTSHEHLRKKVVLSTRYDVTDIRAIPRKKEHKKDVCEGAMTFNRTTLTITALSIMD